MNGYRVSWGCKGERGATTNNWPDMLELVRALHGRGDGDECRVTGPGLSCVRDGLTSEERLDLEDVSLRWTR